MRFLVILFMMGIISCTVEEKKQESSKMESDSIINNSIDSIVPKKITKPKINPNAPKGVFKNKTYNDIIMAVIKTNLGDMTFELYPNRAPIATENFINLARRGFYNGNIFFRLVQDFVAQTGDKSNTGYADAGYYFETEHHPDLSHDRAGMLSYANHDSKSNSSQFFITLSAQPQLDDRHPIFGMLINGKEILEKINNSEVGPKDKPKKNITILEIKITGY